MDDRPDADIPFTAGGDFPFVDRAVDAIVVAGIASGAKEATLLGLVLECRRVLRVDGALRIVLDRCGDATRDAMIEAMAATCGIGGRTAAASDIDPSDADAPVGSVAPAVLDFTKPNRQPIGRPLVSIVIPAYHAAFLSRQLEQRARPDL